MATCIRKGIRYKRHKWENGTCKHCGVPRVPHVRKEKK